MDPSELPGAARDQRISDVFYHFEALTSLNSGRTVGRKIGVVQEVILRRYLEASEPLRRRMYLEQKLTGISGASHKVEFSWYAIACHPDLQAGDEVPSSGGLVVEELDEAAGAARVSGPWGAKTFLLEVGVATPRSGPMRAHLDAHGLDLRLGETPDGLYLDVVDRTRLLASLESKRVGAQRFASSDKLGSGIQTIEKAKQASLVAIDLDLKNNGSVKPLETGGQKQTLSFVALGNGVHWTEKDRAVLGTFVDFTFLVRDAAIIRYADFVAELMPDGDDALQHFMDYFQGMTKQGPDGFVAHDEDFTIITPADETRSLREVIEAHLEAVNP